MSQTFVTRLARAVAAAMLLAAVVPLALWAVPSLHRRPTTTLDWDDYADVIHEHVVYRGLDRDGYVRQERHRRWEATRADQLNPLRRAHAAAPAVPSTPLPPPQPWRLQFTDYGGCHVFPRGGPSVWDVGGVRTVPFSFVAVVLAMPAAAWGIAAGAGRVSRTLRGPRPWAASSTGGGPTGTAPGRPG